MEEASINLCSQRKFRLPDTGSIKFTIKGNRGDEVTKKSISTSACMGHNNLTLKLMRFYNYNDYNNNIIIVDLKGRGSLVLARHYVTFSRVKSLEKLDLINIQSSAITKSIKFKKK